MPGSTAALEERPPAHAGGICSEQKTLGQLVRVHNFLHNHMRYIYRQIYNWKGKVFCLNKISFLQTAVRPQSASCSSCLLAPVWSREKPSRQVLPGLSAQHALCCRVRHHTHSGSAQIQCLGLFHSSSSSSSSSPSERDVQGRICR